MEIKKRPVIIDCDTGTDDAIALVALFGSEEVEIKGITSASGNAMQKDTQRNNRNICALLGKDIPVVKGASRSIYPRVFGYDETHGMTGMGDLVLPEAVDYPYADEMAPEFIKRIAEEENGELELITVGPMTNIAIMLTMYPEVAEKIKHLWFMGGAVWGGNMNPVAEFNMWEDPIAATIVFNAGIPMTMVGLDVTEKAIMTKEDEVELRAYGTPAALLVADLLEYMFRRNEKGGEDAMMHDSLAVAAAIFPECLEFTDYYVVMDWAGRYTAGHTHADIYRESGKKPNMSCAMKVDVPMFRKWIVSKIKNV